jgi:serine/threonine-protein kinase
LKRSLVIDPKCTIAKNNLKAFPETRLHGTTMQFSNLSEVNLSLSCLSRANLRDARVLETKLSYVDLSQTNLRDAHLNQSSLRQADLCGTDLCGANLKGALVTAEQLAQVISLQNTIMPDGSIHLLKLPRA